ncbi:hypothetical protein TTHERM_00497130 (macronuclear) [Tetrahymena thermophila SB210]|uniref:Uncharacterized protein n=1 Tax=Tetrahymena thermophila (strain SB210) TaxID=312017 RepID=I7M4M1_TETTS|nr:hypothetical protein TTHERM_00497130 [Tetrahymena thermophila SB210]EAS07660.1 hypothetical protein TTHERM_00497130 [Tetrahymena thermophila SB210]|eukprot:XP_001027902.1 hypothetical protein TTHERM_00497130 [Tetrahymena thermophila SB210]
MSSSSTNKGSNNLANSMNEKDILKEVALDRIVQLNFNEETLKRNFEIIIKYLRMLKDGHLNTQNELDDIRAKMEKQQQENLELLKKNQQNDLIKNELQQMKDAIKENEKNLASVQNDNQKLKEDNQKAKEENNQLRENIEKLKETLGFLKEKLEKFGNTEQLEHKFDQKLEQKLIMLKELQRQMNDLNDRLKLLENKGNLSAKSDLDSMQQDLLGLKLRLNKLNGLVIQDGDKAELHQFIQSGSSQNLSQPERIEEMEKNMKQVIQDMQESVINALGSKKLQQKKDENTVKQERELEDIKNDLKYLEKAFQKTANINKTDDKLVARQREIEELKRIMGDYQDTKYKFEGGSGNNGGAANASLIDDKMNKMRKELMALLKGLKEELNTKADKTDLLKLEEYLNNKLREMDALYNEKFANKEDTLQALSFLEKKINNLYQIIKQQNKPLQEDGLIVRRPLWSCIVCDKGQQNYNAKLGKHKVWNNFPVPKDNSPERANGKFAKGYRNMQETAKQRNQFKFQSATMASHNASPDSSPGRQNSIEGPNSYTNPYISDQDFKTPDKLPPVNDQHSLQLTARNQRSRSNNLSTYN